MDTNFWLRCGLPESLTTRWASSAIVIDFGLIAEIDRFPIGFVGEERFDDALRDIPPITEGSILIAFPVNHRGLIILHGFNELGSHKLAHLTRAVHIKEPQNRVLNSIAQGIGADILFTREFADGVDGLGIYGIRLGNGKRHLISVDFR